MTTSDDATPPTVADLALLGQLLDEYRPRLLAMLGRRIDPSLAVRIDPEEVLNEAYFDLRRKWAWFRAQTDLSAYAWLYRVVLDRLIETWRRETRDKRDLHRDLPWPEQSSVQLGLSLVNPGTSPSAAAARGEVREQMQQALGLLKPAEREVLWMRHAEQLSFREIGQVLGASENAVTQRYVRALKKLKGVWDALHNTGGNDG